MRNAVPNPPVSSNFPGYSCFETPGSLIFVEVREIGFGGEDAIAHVG
jgi:hypothetical protein